MVEPPVKLSVPSVYVETEAGLLMELVLLLKTAMESTAFGTLAGDQALEVPQTVFEPTQVLVVAWA